MATSLLNSMIQVIVKGDLYSPVDLATALTPTNLQRGSLYDNGTGAGQVDRIWHDTRTLTASSSEDLDLSGAALLDPYGNAVVFARVKVLMISAALGNTNNVVVGGVASGLSTILAPAATGTEIIRPGGGMAWWAGPADATGAVVTATTADLLHVANSGAGTSVTYDIIVLGCSA